MALAGATLVLTACGSSAGGVPKGYYTSTPAPASGSAATSSSASRYLQADDSTRMASLRLVAASNGALGGFNFDGYGNGQLTVTIPVGWRVTVVCTNQAAIPHSCAIVQGAGATAPAFPGASTPDPTRGLRRGQSASFSFTTAEPGTYRIACLVPGHEDAGMWDVLKVAGTGTPSVATG